MKILSLLLVLVLMGLPVWADETFEAGISASWARVGERYPEARDANSAFRVRMMELLDGWEATGDPRLHELNAPELLAAEVEAEFTAREQRRKRAARAKRAVQARPVAPARPWWEREKDDTVISAGPPPSSATIYGADGSIRRVFSTGTGSATIYGPEGVTRIFPK